MKLIRSFIIFILIIAAGVFACINWFRSAHKHNFAFLSEQFSPIFDDVNIQLDGEFSYKYAEYEYGNVQVYHLDYLGDDENFIAAGISFYNSFYSCVMDDKYDAFRLESNHLIRIYADKKFLMFWRCTPGTCLVTTNVPCDFSVFETVTDIEKLVVVTSKFTDEQKEYAESLQDEYSFKLVFSDSVPW